MSTAANSQAVATVISVSGLAFARNADGAVRRLAAGDTIREGEIVFTMADGQIELAFSDGHHATILPSESYLIGPESMIATSPDVGEAAIAAAGEVGKVVTALEGQGDILEGLEAPAAGGAGAENAGNSFVRLLRIVEPVTPIGFEFPVNPIEEIRAPEGTVIPEEENDFPTISSSSGAVDEEGLEGGNAGDSYASGDLPGEATSYTGTLLINYGTDGFGSLVISTPDDPTAIWDGTTLTASDGSWTLTNNGDGTYTFTLKDPQAHTYGDNTEGDLVFNFVATATDSNGDSASTNFSITVDDDAPTTSGNIQVQLDDDVLAGTTIPDGTGDVTPNTANTDGYVGFSFGADGAGSVQWLTNVTTSGGATGFTYEKSGNDLLIKQDGTTVITVTMIPATGAYTVTQNAPLKHATGGDENDQSFTLTYRVTDADGDTKDGTLTINVDDDSPYASITDGRGSVTIDETPDLQDDDTNSTEVSDLFNLLTGVSLDMEQYAQSSSSLIDTSGSSYGADGAGTTTVSLAINGGNGTDSGLETTGGTQIFLYLENGMIVGRIGNEVGDGTDTANASGTIAFAIYLAQDGKVSVAQYASITNPTPGDGSGGTHDETASLNGKVNAVVAVTDADGDTATSFVNIGDQILFSDDGPTAVNEDTQEIYEGYSTVTDVFNGTVDVPASNNSNNYQFITSISGIGGGNTLNLFWTGSSGSTTVNWQLRASDGTTVVASGTGSSNTGTLSATLSSLLATGDYQLWVDAENKAFTINNVTVEHDVSASLSGNVLDNGDSFGEDEEGGIVSAITYTDGTGPHTVAVVPGGTTVTTLYGTLTIFQDGSYVYASGANVVEEGSVFDNFIYTIMDGDGDTDTATMSFEVKDVPQVVPSAAYFTMNTSNTGGGGDTGFQKFLITVTSEDNAVDLTKEIQVANQEGQQNFFVELGQQINFANNTHYHVVLEYVSGSAHLNFTEFALTDQNGKVATLNAQGGSDNVTLTGSESSNFDGVIYNITIDGLGNITVSEPVGYDLNTVNGDDVLVLNTTVNNLDFTLDMDDLPIENGVGGRNLFGEIDRIDISGSNSENNTLVISAQDVLDLVDGDMTLWITGDSADKVQTSDSWTPNGTASLDGVSYYSYTFDLGGGNVVTLNIEQDVMKDGF